MPRVTEEMIESCFNAYFTEDQDITPAVKLGMNENSAKMTIVWFRCLFDGELYKRRVPTMQVEWILNKLYEDQDFDKLNNVLISLVKYCEHYKEPMTETRALVEEFGHKV